MLHGLAESLFLYSAPLINHFKLMLLILREAVLGCDGFKGVPLKKKEKKRKAKVLKSGRGELKAPENAKRDQSRRKGTEAKHIVLT